MGLFSSITNAVNSVVDTVQDVANDVADVAQDVANSVIDGAQGAVNGAIDTVQDGFIAAAGGLDGLFGTSFFRDGVDYLNSGIDIIQAVPNEVLDKAQELKDLTFDTVQAAGNLVVDDLVQIPLTAPSLMTDFFKTWIETGEMPDFTELDTKLPELQGQEQGEQLIGKAKSLLELD